MLNQTNSGIVKRPTKEQLLSEERLIENRPSEGYNAILSRSLKLYTRLSLCLSVCPSVCPSRHSSIHTYLKHSRLELTVPVDWAEKHQQLATLTPPPPPTPDAHTLTNTQPLTLCGLMDPSCHRSSSLDLRWCGQEQEAEVDQHVIGVEESPPTGKSW